MARMIDVAKKSGSFDCNSVICAEWQQVCKP